MDNHHYQQFLLPLHYCPIPGIYLCNAPGGLNLSLLTDPLVADVCQDVPGWAYPSCRMEILPARRTGPVLHPRGPDICLTTTTNVYIIYYYGQLTPPSGLFIQITGTLWAKYNYYMFGLLIYGQRNHVVSPKDGCPEALSLNYRAHDAVPCL